MDALRNGSLFREPEITSPNHDPILPAIMGLEHVTQVAGVEQDIIIQKDQNTCSTLPGAQVTSSGISLIALPEIAQGERKRLRFNRRCAVRRAIVHNDDLKSVTGKRLLGERI